MARKKALWREHRIVRTYLLYKETEIRIMEIFLKRLKKDRRCSKSNIIDEAVHYLWTKELEKE